ncbi:MAG: hypothetical protein JSV35_02535 [Candidatus Bathyarchaeota archaeon]|nr:MAG: hypothetical protein JSV35_02535 [Candidatus Bathyarchaeota archaeon]
MDTGRAVVIASCWFSLALIASVYMFVFAERLGDALFGVFLPVGLLVLVGLVVTLLLASSSEA